MGSNQIIIWLIIACVVLMIVAIFAKPVRFALFFATRAAIGVIGFAICNSLTALMGITVGVNFFTVVFVGILGLPGFATLYLLNIVL